MSEWAKIDQWMKEDSPWLFETARPVPHRGPGPTPEQALRHLQRLAEPSPTLETIAPPPGLDARLCFALRRCPRLTLQQLTLAARLIARHRPKGKP